MLSERSALLPRNDLQVPLSDKVKNYASLSFSTLLALIGSGAMVFYFGPAETCANNEGCGEWLVKLVGYNTAYIILAHGGVNYALMNVFLSFNSRQKFFNYLKSQPTGLARFLKGSSIVTLASLQTLRSLIVSLTTKTAAWQPFVSVASVIPSNLFAMTNLAEYEIPLVYNHLHYSIKHRYYLSRKHSLSHEKLQELDRETFYEFELIKFRRRLHKTWKGLLPLVSRLELPIDQDPLTLLFQHENLATHEVAWWEQATNRIVDAVAIILALNLSAPFYFNAFHFTEKYIPTQGLQGIIAFFLMSSPIYVNVLFARHGLRLLADTPLALLRLKPFEQALFHLRPKTMSAAIIFSIIMSICSHALADVVYNNEMPPPDQGARKVFRIGADIGLSIYHLGGLYQLSLMLLALLIRAPKDKKWVEMQNTITRFDRMDRDGFALFCTTNTAEQNEAYGLNCHSSDMSALLESAPTPVPSPIQSETELSKPDRSQNIFCCFWKKPSLPSTTRISPLPQRHSEVNRVAMITG